MQRFFDEVIISYHPERADYKHCTEVSNILAKAGVEVSIQTCLPSSMDRCIEACKYFHENSLAGSHLAKALQVSLAGHETFVYDEEKLKEAYSYDDRSKVLSRSKK